MSAFRRFSILFCTINLALFTTGALSDGKFISVRILYFGACVTASTYLLLVSALLEEETKVMHSKIS